MTPNKPSNIKPILHTAACILMISGTAGAGHALPAYTNLLFCFLLAAGQCCLLADITLRMQKKIRGAATPFIPTGVVCLIVSTFILCKYPAPSEGTWPYITTILAGWILFSTTLLHGRMKKHREPLE